MSTIFNGLNTINQNDPFLNRHSLSPRIFFLIDGFGAIVSALFLGVVLTHFQPFFGMPSNTLYGLATAAIVFSGYSFSCYFLKPKNWRPFLRAIGNVNLAYCSLTLLLTVGYFHELTSWGITYFFLEIVLIAGLALWELKKTRRKAK